MTAASVVNYVGRTVMAIAGPDLAREYGFSETELGQIFSSFWLGYAILMWPSGWLADRFGAARVLALCGLATAALSAGTAYASTLAGFLILRFLFGAASAVLYPACGNITTQAFRSENFASVQGLVVGGSSLGTALTPLLVTALSGWRSSFLVAGLVTAVFFGLWGLRVVNSGAASSTTPFRLHSATLLLGMQSFCVGYYYNFTDTWSYYYFKEVRSFGAGESALFTFLLQLTGGLAMPLGGWIADRIAPHFGRRVPAVAALLAAGLCVAAGSAATVPSIVLALITASYALVVGVEGLYSWGVLASTPESPGAAYGFTNMAGSVAQFLAPLTFPWLAARSGWTMSVCTAAGALGIAALLWYVAAGKIRTYNDRSQP